MIKIWLKFLSNKRNFNISIITILLFGAISLFFSWFLVWVENRDPYLGEFIDPLFFWDPIDLSTPTFFLTYGIIGFYILHHISSPLKIVYFIQMLIFIVACRIVSLTLIQFDAPEVVWSTAQAANIEGQTLIQLADPILNNIIYHQDTALIYLTKKDLNDYNFVKGDTEGFVNYPLSLKGVVFSVFFIEFNDGIKISFRSKYDFDVNKFARLHFNGGGHKNASGGKVTDLNLKETIDYFISLLPKYKNELS